MKYVVRKINRVKWPEKESDVFDIPSDAITSCLKSSKNELSVWEIDNEDKLDDAVLALVANFDHLESIDVVILDGKELLKANVKYARSKGNTPVVDLQDTHIDLCQLNYFSVGIIAEHIVRRIVCKKIHRYTVSDLKSIIKDAIAKKRLQIADLNESIAKKIS